MSMIRHILCALIVISVMAFPRISQAETPDTTEGQKTMVIADQAHIGQNVITNSKLPIQKATTLRTVDFKEIQCLAKNIFYESASEPEEGKVAVGVVTLNRTNDKRFAPTVCGVINQRSGGAHHRGSCQFSWRCGGKVRPPRIDDHRWVKCQEIATNLLTQPDVYQSFTKKYSNALYFHATFVRPLWARQKVRVARVGNQWFYGDRRILNT